MKIVLDTNVLMHDPSSLFRFEEHDIYLPMVTLEELGLCYATTETCGHIPAIHREIVDPTGAGDTFAGGFMGYLANTGNLSDEGVRQAIVFGSVMASFTVEDFSLNRMKRLTYPEIEARYRDFKALTHFQGLPGGSAAA